MTSSAYRRFFPGIESGQGVTLTIYPNSAEVKNE
jgi:hypothetical protein